MPDNIYASGFPGRCINCVCHYCTAYKCPAGRLQYLRSGKHDFCFNSDARGACPRLDCDFFTNKLLRVKTKYVIRSKAHRQAPLTKAVNEMSKQLRELEKIVNQNLTNNQTK